MPWKLALFPLKMILFIYLFIYLFMAVLGLLLSLLCVGFLCLWQTGLLSSWGVRASHCGGFSCWGAQALGCVGLSTWGHMGLVALQHVGSSRTRDQTHVPCWQADAYPLYHGESPGSVFNNSKGVSETGWSMATPSQMCPILSDVRS